MTTMQSSTWYYSDIAVGGTSDKEYHLQLEKKGSGYVVNFQHGRRGGTLQTGCKTPQPVSLAEATAVYDREVKIRLGKSYKPSTAAQAGPVEAANPGTVSEYPVELLEEVTEEQADTYIRSENYWMQVKVDGHRVQVERTPTGFVGYSRKGTTRALPSEVTTELAKCQLKTFVMDGELVGSAYIAFDILQANGVNLTTDAQYRERYRILERALATIPNNAVRRVTLVPTWIRPTEKQAALRLLRKKGCEGAVFRLIDAPYSGGRNNHKKFKFVKSVSCKVTAVGFKSKDNAVLAVLDGKTWLEVGRASTIGKGPIKVGDIVDVTFLYATAGRRLYQPRITSVRDDLTYSACTLAQLNGKYKEGVAA